MSTVTRTSRHCKFPEQHIQMEYLLPDRFSRQSTEYNMLDDLNSIIPYATLRMRNITEMSPEDCADAIASHLQASNKFMQDDPASERFRIETVKAMPHCLTVKRSVKSQLLATVTRDAQKKQIGYWTWLKYTISLKFRKIQMALRNFLLTIKPWHQTIKSIESHSGSGVATYFKFLRWLLFLNIISCILSISFIVIPQSLDQTHVSNNIYILDFLTGSGFFSHTILYYGFYSNGTVDTAFGTKYNIPFAYFLTLLLCYIIIFIILSVKVITSYRESYVESCGKIHDLYSNKIFCGWDFSISSPKTASLQSASIYKELEELLAEMRQRTHMNWLARCFLIIRQLFITSIVLFMICCIGALVWVLLDYHDMQTSGTLSAMIVPLVVTAIIHTFPAIISYLVSIYIFALAALLEHYNNKRTELYVTVIRNHAVAATIIGTLFAFWIIHSTSHCWQTDLGEEIYRLIVLDFIASILEACLQFIRLMLYKRYSMKIDSPEFDIARSTLNLIYNQTLFWMGFYFSPLMSLIIVIKLVFMFYVKRYQLKKCYQQPSQPWRAAQTQTLFLALAFLGMIGVLLTIGYVLTKVQSNDCGPFRDYVHTWDFIVDGILLLKRDSAFWNVITELARPATGVIILVIMCIAVYCLRAKVQASKEMLQILSDMLLLQSQDKQFLIKSLAKLVEEHAAIDSTNLAEHSELINQNGKNEEVLLTHRRNLPSTSSQCSDES